MKSDDGFLVLDRNGSIDSGADLFGIDTALSNGGNATDGFAALRDLDSNGDRVMNSQDARFGELRVWRDLDQDGVSDAGELQSLSDLGITAINLNAKAAWPRAADPTPTNWSLTNALLEFHLSGSDTDALGGDWLTSTGRPGHSPDPA